MTKSEPNATKTRIKGLINDALGKGATVPAFVDALTERGVTMQPNFRRDCHGDTTLIGFRFGMADQSLTFAGTALGQGYGLTGLRARGLAYDAARDDVYLTMAASRPAGKVPFACSSLPIFDVEDEQVDLALDDFESSEAVVRFVLREKGRVIAGVFWLDGWPDNGNEYLLLFLWRNQHGVLRSAAMGIIGDWEFECIRTLAYMLDDRLAERKLDGLRFRYPTDHGGISLVVSSALSESVGLRIEMLRPSYIFDDRNGARLAGWDRIVVPREGVEAMAQALRSAKNNDEDSAILTGIDGRSWAFRVDLESNTFDFATFNPRSRIRQVLGDALRGIQRNLIGG